MVLERLGTQLVHPRLRHWIRSGRRGDVIRVRLELRINNFNFSLQSSIDVFLFYLSPQY